jgi:diguanylate cyclase (GGDEF)-like protein/PAS domain S-box-containing protein
VPTLGQSEIRRGQRGLATQSAATHRRPLLRILFIQSDLANVQRCLQELKNVRFRVRADVVLTHEQFAEQLRSQPYDLVVAEYASPNGQGMQALELLHRTQKQIPLIFVTDKMRRETAAELITKGAADCIAMDRIAHLPIAIRRALDETRLRQERDLAENKLRHSEAHYRALVGNLSYGMCRCSMDGKFLDVNQALVTMLGYKLREELLGADLVSGILQDPGKRAQLLGHYGQEDRADPVEIDWKRKDGVTLKVRLSGREVSSEEGEMDGYEVIAEDVTKQRELEDHLRQQAAKDPLTGLANYRHLVDVLDAEIKRSKRTGREFAVLLFDLDRLKQINDRYGHMTGSQALCRLADVLCICCRDIDTAARLGGDEFSLVLPETGGEAANRVAQRICDSFANDGKEPKLSVSVGVAIYPKDAERIDTLLSAADVAMYSMKGQRRSFSSDRNDL